MDFEAHKARLEADLKAAFSQSHRVGATAESENKRKSPKKKEVSQPSPAVVDSFASQHQDLDEGGQEIDLNVFSTVEKDCQLELKMR